MNHEKQRINLPDESDGLTRPIASGEIKQKTVKPPKQKGAKRIKKDGKLNKDTVLSDVKSVLQCVFYVAVVIGISYFLATNLAKWANDIFAFKKENNVTYTITLGEYANLDQISKELENNGIIEYAEVFKLYSKLRKDNGRYLTGQVELNSQMDYDTIRDKLKYKTLEVKEIRITIPEGFSCEQIIDLLVANGIGDKEEYKRVINSYDFEFDFLPAIESISDKRDYRLEGYLFPDTYDFTPLESEVDVINKFLRNFKVKFEEQYYSRAKKLGMTVDDVVILASIIEKEAKIATDYELISSVFHNRLKSSSFPRLESCATINYFLDEPTIDITQEMIDMKNPYNTYKYEGLPPGPICNPGYEALAYAFYPESTNYYYFVSSIDGTTYYATNYAQHQKNIATARRVNEAIKKQ